MRRLLDIDLLGDDALQSGMAIQSLWILVVGTTLGVLGAIAFPCEPVSLLWFVLLFVLSLVALPLHELVHALAFEVMTGFAAHVRFGFSDWMLHTSAPGTVLSRHKFFVVLLAPAVIVTTTLLLGGCAAGWPLLGWFLAVVHLAGCTGDFGYARIIASEPRASFVEDTDRGIALFYDA